ncbi:hypothetical protein [Paraburkholderia tropica]|uniref:hypothetical protein n=1 Tax=Paraburkholderia tropica TaxID=92647 RepID=UPI0007EC3543|nr:hypothetical protein [Paraburkholderia tropica]OBR52380.1 hypothetical protein A6456_10810 [Paraburkholderia tropica]
MNLRILKKLSKRAAPLLVPLGDEREQFAAEKGRNYQHLGGHDRKHWDRMRSIHADAPHGSIAYLPKHGQRWIHMRTPYHPLKGTVMVGAMCGYYEPEWEEETAWESLSRLVCEHFTDWDENGPVFERTFRYPSEILRAAHKLIAARAAA